MNTDRYTIVGQKVKKVDDIPKITGSGAYIADIYLLGMLYGKVLRSPHAHAKIARIDCAEAWKVKGVRAVITARDTPQKRFSFIQTIADKECLCTAQVRYINDNLTDYKLPGPHDIPRINYVFIETEDNEGPYGAKGIGEFPLVAVAPAIGNAVYHAVGVRLKELPFTPEKVLTALRLKMSTI